MDRYCFLRYKIDFWTRLKNLRSYLYTDVAPTVLGLMLIFAGLTMYFENDRSTMSIFNIIAGIIIMLYMIYRWWKLYKKYKSPKIISITIDEKGICVEFSKHPFKIESCWEDVASIQYFPGELDEGLRSSVEYLAYIDIYALFKDQRKNEYKYALKIVNDDWWNEQGETVFSALLKQDKVNVEII